MASQSKLSIIGLVRMQIDQISRLKSEQFGSHRGYVPKYVKIAPELKEQLQQEIINIKGLHSLISKDEVEFKKVFGVEIRVADSVREMNPDNGDRTLGFPVQVLMRIRTEEEYQELKMKENEKSNDMGVDMNTQGESSVTVEQRIKESSGAIKSLKEAYAEKEENGELKPNDDPERPNPFPKPPY